MLVRHRELKNNHQLPFKWDISFPKLQKRYLKEGKKRVLYSCGCIWGENGEERKQSYNKSLRRTKLTFKTPINCATIP